MLRGSSYPGCGVWSRQRGQGEFDIGGRTGTSWHANFAAAVMLVKAEAVEVQRTG